MTLKKKVPTKKISLHPCASPPPMIGVSISRLCRQTTRMLKSTSTLLTSTVLIFLARVVCLAASLTSDDKPGTRLAAPCHLHTKKQKNKNKNCIRRQSLPTVALLPTLLSTSTPRQGHNIFRLSFILASLKSCLPPGPCSKHN